jgi:phage terminase small subunit
MDKETFEKVQMIAMDLTRLLTDIAHNDNADEAALDLREALPDLEQLVKIAEDL